MYRKNNTPRTTLRVNDSYEGETIELKIDRITNNKEPITDGAPLIYTDRSEGVIPDHDIRTDRFEVAVEAMDKIDRSNKARREAYHKKLEEDNKTPEQKAADAAKKGNGGAEPAAGTDTK